MDLPEIIRRRRTELGMSQAELAAAAGVDPRQVRRYEAGEQQPALSVAVAIAKALNISVGELAGEPSHRINLSGDWWCAWQTYKDGNEVINAHEAKLTQRGDTIQIAATTRGTELSDGAYLWRGELQVWDNEVLMGWYVATEAAVRSKGVFYFVLHPHGVSASGRWVGTSYDGAIITGWGALARSEDGTRKIIEELKTHEGLPPWSTPPAPTPTPPPAKSSSPAPAPNGPPS